jgi:UDP-N-acetylenolpyruvoylglucosamine reductase
MTKDHVIQGLYERLSLSLSAEAVMRLDEPLAKRTTFRVGGKADLYLEPAGETDLSHVVKAVWAAKVPLLLLGRGSNLLIRDGGIRGVVVCLQHPVFQKIEVEGVCVRCGAGAKLKSVANEARRQGVAGLEYLEGIPGTVGGALRMNAGAMGFATFDRVEVLRWMNQEGHAADLPASQVQVGYRSCPLLRTGIALGAVFRGVPGEREAIRVKMDEFSQRRWQTQPHEPSAGCVFKNPPAIPAGKLIQELGLKGVRVGGATVSTLHGNFIVNEGQATADDVLRLIELVRCKALETRGIQLETEIEVLGDE